MQDEQDKELSPEDEAEEPIGDSSSASETPSDSPAPATDEVKTVSLLDLMREIGEPGSPSAESDQPAIEDEEATPTGPSVPRVLPESQSPPPPLDRQEPPAGDRPSQEDEDATKVQPRSAFPGQTQLGPAQPPATPGSLADQPTQPLRPVRPAPRPRPPQPVGQQADLPRGAPLRTQQPAQQQPTPVMVTPSLAVPSGRSTSPGIGRWLGCAGRILLVGFLVLVVGFVLTSAAAAVGCRFLHLILLCPLSGVPPHLEKSQVFLDLPVRNGLVIALPLVCLVCQEGVQHSFAHDLFCQAVVAQYFDRLQQIARQPLGA